MERTRILTTCQQMFSKDLSDDEVAYWKNFLKQFSMIEIRYAFEHWNSHERWFPKPKDISDLCDAYRLLVANIQFSPGCHRCNWDAFYETKKAGYKERVVAQCPCVQNPSLREQQPLHNGTGYGTNDMLWMFKRMQQVYAAGDTPDTEELLNELDRKRPDGAPEWRKNAG